MNNDEQLAALQRLGPRGVRILVETGYYRELDEQAKQRALEHDKRRQAAAKTLRQRKRK